MSFDVYFQGFSDGDARGGGGEQMAAVLAPHSVREDDDGNVAAIEIGDGTADIYLSPTSMMANHISGEDPWDLLVAGARAAGWVILPIGCPTCLTDESQRPDLPEGLDDNVVVVRSGADLLRAIRSS